MKDILRVGVVQQQNKADLALNRDRLKAAIIGCVRKGARLVVLQELHNTLYFCQREDPGHFDLAEEVPGPSTEYFGALAREEGIVLVLSVFEKRMAGVYHNTAVAIDSDGSVAGLYRKMHIPHDPGYNEKYYFTPGDTGFAPIETSVGRLGVLVCWDQWFPESARIMALRGADILIYPTAIGWEPADMQEEKDRQLEAWITVQRAHAIANGLPVVVANRVGHEADSSGRSDGIAFWGSSFIVGPQGEFLARAPSDAEHIMVGELSSGRTEAVRRTWPFFRDRRVDHYGELLNVAGGLGGKEDRAPTK